MRHLEATLSSHGIWLGELRHQTRDGREVEVEARLALISQRNGRWLVLEVNCDITDRPQAEAMAEAMARQLDVVRSLYPASGSV